MDTQLTSTPILTVDLTGLPEPVVQSIQQLVALWRTHMPNRDQSAPATKQNNLFGCLADKNLTIPTEADLDELRHEMWANFPRDVPDPAAR